MAAIRRVNHPSNNAFRIPTSAWGLILALLINFFRARFKQWAGVKRSLLVAPVEIPEQDLLSEETLRALTNTLNAPIPYSISSSLAQASLGGGTQVKSNFITDPEILKTFTNPKLWHECREQGDRFHWVDRGATPQNVWEEMVVRIWKDHPLVVDGTLAGFEYWCNVIVPGAPLKWHVDKDEAEYAEHKNLVTPYMGAVWYGYPHEMTGGGHLELFPFHPTVVADPSAIADIDDRVERISPNYNRLVFLNVSEWHQVTPIKSGARYTLAVNAWKEKPKAAIVHSDGSVEAKPQEEAVVPVASEG